jgi:purine-nucleoside phosphorylase
VHAGLDTLTDIRVAEAVASLRSMGARRPSTALILGSGLGPFAETLPSPLAIPTKSIPNYPVSTVEGHKGELLFATVFGHSVVAFRGRLHFYESGNLGSVLFPIRVAAAIGAQNLLVTNAAGGINRQFVPGDLMLISDQIDLTGEHVFQGSPQTMALRHSVYDPALGLLAESVADELGVSLKKGVYAGVKGPSYETAGEIEMIYRLGGDAVGMSTVLETRLAAQLGLRVLGISCITNRATGTSPAKLSHEEVTEVADRVRDRFARLLMGILKGFADQHEATN